MTLRIWKWCLSRNTINFFMELLGMLVPRNLKISYCHPSAGCPIIWREILNKDLLMDAIKNREATYSLPLTSYLWIVKIFHWTEIHLQTICHNLTKLTSITMAYKMTLLKVVIPLSLVFQRPKLNWAFYKCWKLKTIIFN